MLIVPEIRVAEDKEHYMKVEVILLDNWIYVISIQGDVSCL